VIQIRRFEAHDGEAVKRLITEIMDSEFQAEKAAFSAEDLEVLNNSYGNLGEAFFVAEEGKKIIGTVGVKRENERVALLRRIFVAPEYRKKKIGLRLLNRAIEFCEEVGYRELVFRTTSRMTGAIELVKKQGFQPRAKVPMGQIELLKFTRSLKGRKS
jgi:N-acetylglutamate synthase-like GNAT family acetyltransferase